MLEEELRAPEKPFIEVRNRTLVVLSSYYFSAKPFPDLSNASTGYFLEFALGDVRFLHHTISAKRFVATPKDVLSSCLWRTPLRSFVRKLKNIRFAVAPLLCIVPFHRMTTLLSGSHVIYTFIQKSCLFVILIAEQSFAFINGMKL